MRFRKQFDAVGAFAAAAACAVDCSGDPGITSQSAARDLDLNEIARRCGLSDEVSIRWRPRMRGIRRRPRCWSRSACWSWPPRPLLSRLRFLPLLRQWQRQQPIRLRPERFSLDYGAVLERGRPLAI
jgi:hypothetical protein